MCFVPVQFHCMRFCTLFWTSQVDSGTYLHLLCGVGHATIFVLNPALMAGQWWDFLCTHSLILSTRLDRLQVLSCDSTRNWTHLPAFVGVVTVPLGQLFCSWIRIKTVPINTLNCPSSDTVSGCSLSSCYCCYSTGTVSIELGCNCLGC